MESSEAGQASGALHRDQADVEFSRVVAFSDGVFAIAITLLVLSLHLPDSADELGSALTGQLDELLAYAISFAVVGRFWLSHHRFYGALERFDGTLMGLNLLYLAWIVLVPFSSDLLGNFGEEPLAVIIYACNLVAVSATFMVQIVYAYRRGLVRPDARAMEHRWAGPANFLTIGVFLLSIPVAFLNTTIAQAMWLAIFLGGHRAGDWLADRRSAG